MTDINFSKLESEKYFNQPQYSSTDMPTSSIISRRAKVEQKRLLIQIALFGGLAVVVLAVSAFVIIPGVIRSLTNSSPVAQVDNSLPLQPPVLAAPVQATFSSQIQVTGFGAKGNQVVLTDNGQEIQKMTVGDDGSFNFTVPLQKGDNQLSAYAIDPNQKHSAASQTYDVIFNDQPPKLQLDQPQDKQSFFGHDNQMLTVKGSSDPNVKIYLNDRIVFTREDGTFTTQFQMQNGDNPLTIKAVDQAGNVTQVQLTVSYSQ